MYARSKVFQKLRILGPNLCRCESTDAGNKKLYSKDFFENQVQKLLYRINKVDLEKLFSVRYDNKPLQKGRLELVTAEQLELEKMNIERKSQMLLQVPPLVDPIEDKLEVLDTNPSLDGHDFQHSKFIFTDISDGYINEERIIVVREPNGTLRKAFRNERHRMNQIFFPIPGRCYEMPKMFEEEHLMNLIDQEQYLFILERACVQFDPDDPMYHKVIEATYERINDKFHFETLESTRHYGSLAFYLVSHKKIDNMLIYMIRTDRLEKAHFLVQLYHIIHPDCKSAEKAKTSKTLLKDFIDFDANKKDELELEFQNYEKKVEAQKEVEKGIKEAHGV